MKNQLPPGKYYIGDPCYVIEDEFWGDWLDEFWSNRGVVFTYDNYEQIAFNTAWGDGCYSCSNGASLGVDAGLIGAIPMDIITRGQPEEDGTVVTFDTHFKCRDISGLLWFGDVWVQTDPDDDQGDDAPCDHCGR